MIVKDGYPFIFSAVLIFGIGTVFLGPWCALPGVLVLVFLCNFFRNPERVPPPGNSLVSPADGKVICLRELNPAESEGYGHFVSIFMNVFNVHVNRTPMSGTITAYEYHPGKFKAAWDESATVENEHNLITVEEGGRRVRFSQVAGLLARRIVFWMKPGDVVTRAQRIGLIRFGSRVDLWLPPDAKIAVSIGDRVKAGTSVLATFEE